MQQSCGIFPSGAGGHGAKGRGNTQNFVASGPGAAGTYTFLVPALDHLGIAVRDLRAAARVYELLGFATAGPEEEIAAEGVRVLMLPLASGRIELLAPTREDSPVGRFLARRGEGLHHVALAVEDLTATVAGLRAAGARLAHEEPQVGAGGRRYVFVHPTATGGVLIELVEKMAEKTVEKRVEKSEGSEREG